MRNFLLFAALLLAASCNRSMLDPSDLSGDDYGSSLYHEMIVLGSRLEDPYSVSNITKALASVYPTKADRVVVEATHVYMRFLPANDDEMTALKDLDLQLLDHPVNYEIVREGDYYHDPEVPEGDITWQYVVVEKDYVFPDKVSSITHEILDECYIPTTDGETKSADGIDWEAVERESYILTGNSAMLGDPTKAASGIPAGRITIVDDKLPSSTIGLKGVKVSCNSFVKFAHGYTDANGNYQVDKKFSSNPRYRIVFTSTKGFNLGFNLILQPASASTLGKNSPQGLDVTITKNSDRKLFTRSVVNNATYDYYTSCNSSDGYITQPPSNLRIWLFQNMSSSSAIMMQQGAIIDNSLISDFLGTYTSLIKMFLPDLTIGVSGKESYSEIYASTIHELAHASHFMQAGTTFWNKYIKHILTSYVTSGWVVYGTGTEENAGYCEVGEMWGYFMETLTYRERYDTSDYSVGTTYWFFPQILLYLNERGINKYKIFAALSSDINSRDMLQKKLISMYPESKSEINQAFARYY